VDFAVRWSHNTVVGKSSLPGEDVEHQGDSLEAEHVISSRVSTPPWFSVYQAEGLPVGGNINFQMRRLGGRPIGIMFSLFQRKSEGALDMVFVARAYIFIELNAYLQISMRALSGDSSEH
jgi:hypothetical protein